MPEPTRFLTALPVYNEAAHVAEVLSRVREHSRDVLVVDDGSTDGTADILRRIDGVRIVTHARNRGYGAALRTAFEQALTLGYELLVTIDCDGQHEPQLIGPFVAKCREADIVSGSRYLRRLTGDSRPPAERRRINQQITADLNRRLCLELTDAFCGFKAYHARALRKLRLTEDGYAMPLELWVQAAHHRLDVVELPVPLIYLDEKRSFGGVLDDPQTRLDYYRTVLDRSLAAVGAAPASPASAAWPGALVANDRAETERRAIEAPRWKAPAANGASLIDPSLKEAARRLAERALPQGRGAALDLDLTATAKLARDELLRAAARHTRQYADVDDPPGTAAGVVLAGHQPTLFHPGVWLKNAVLGWFVHTTGASAVNVNVDNDTLKAPSIRVPGGPPGAIRAESESYDAPGDEVPYEEREVLDAALFASFGPRVAQRIAPLAREPLVESYWPLVLHARGQGMRLGDALAAGRHLWELARGNRTWEVPLSKLCGGEAFGRLTAAWLLGAGPGLSAYNHAILDYRARHRVRSRSHPAPLLEQRDDWLEAPFWCWSARDPRRRRVFVNRSGDRLRFGNPGRLDWESSARPEAVREVLAEAERAGRKIRPRALLTTLFLRLLGGDLFVHGIGGGLYDRVTDRLMHELFAASPPPYVVATATLLLPGAERSATAKDLRRLEADLRDMTYHAERWLSSPLGEEAARLAAEKQRWIATPQTPANARQRAAAFARLNLALQVHVAHERSRVESQRQRAAESLREAGPLRSREYAFCLFPEKTWGQLLAMLPAMP